MIACPVAFSLRVLGVPLVRDMIHTMDTRALGCDRRDDDYCGGVNAVGAAGMFFKAVQPPRHPLFYIPPPPHNPALIAAAAFSLPDSRDT